MEKMCSKLASYIAKYSGNMEKYEIYKYGLENLVCLLFPSVIILGISIFLHLELEAFTWITCFLPIRIIFGGVHAKKYWNCVMLSVSVALIGFLPLNYMSVKPIIEITIIFFCIYIMMLFAPSRTTKESDASGPYRNQWWKEFIILSIAVCSYIISLLFNSSLHFVIFRSLLTAALSFIISLFQNDRI